eukprot:TRINITY_DN29279_c0_g1_i1.p1 TRINITY_DN29279_c0_g1~~TRINITY_DN29279_c0_g1_i1.p1  ORF type:complete len:530 (+),score=58.25 TRINITY_DN29279_c0_g1_i1:41-1591(+)
MRSKAAFCRRVLSLLRGLTSANVDLIADGLIESFNFSCFEEFELLFDLFSQLLAKKAPKCTYRAEDFVQLLLALRTRFECSQEDMLKQICLSVVQNDFEMFGSSKVQIRSTDVASSEFGGDRRRALMHVLGGLYVHNFLPMKYVGCMFEELIMRERTTPTNPSLVACAAELLQVVRPKLDAAPSGALLVNVYTSRLRELLRPFFFDDIVFELMWSRIDDAFRLQNLAKVAQQEFETAREQLEHAKTAQQQLAESRDQIHDLRTRVAEQEELFETLHQQLASSQSSIETRSCAYHEQGSNLQARLADAEHRLETSHSQVVIERNSSSYHEGLSSLQARLANEEHRAKQLQQELDTKQSMMKQISEEVHGLQARLADAEHRARTSQLELEASQSTINHMSEELQVVQSRLEGEQQRANLAQQQLRESKKVVLSKERHIRTLKGEIVRICKKHVWKPNEHSTDDAATADMTCIVCMSDEREILLQPCNHYVMCRDCLPKCGDVCPVCRAAITGHLRAYC